MDNIAFETNKTKNELIFCVVDFVNLLKTLGLTEGLGKWGLQSGDARLRTPLIAKMASERAYERKSQGERENKEDSWRRSYPNLLS
jgi:hypothetical protein